MKINITKDDVYCKYPRTYHLPYSKGSTNDDKKLSDDLDFVNQEVIITEKIDGENCNLTNDRIWARSVDSKDHPSRNWVQQFWNQIKHEIPDGFRICGENVYAKHSIFYDSLPSYFLVFSIWNGKECLSWSDTLDYCSMLGLYVAPVLYQGVYSRKIIEQLMLEKSLYGAEREGVVVRKPNAFHFDEFPKNVCKNVREKHVRTSKHWMKEKIIPNILKFE